MYSVLIKKINLRGQIYGFTFITKPLTFETQPELFALPLRWFVNYYVAFIKKIYEFIVLRIIELLHMKHNLKFCTTATFIVYYIIAISHYYKPQQAHKIILLLAISMIRVFTMHHIWCC